MSQAEQPLISHLVELRTRLLRSISAILLAFVALIYFSNDIYDFVARPLLSQLPEGTSMIATDVATPFITPIKLTLVVCYIVLGVLALGRDRSTRSRAAYFVAALLVYAQIYFIARTHHPLGAWILLFG